MADFELARTELISQMLGLANRKVMLRSPPATGKSSLLDLTEKTQTKNQYKSHPDQYW
jgi:hypothetical protein